MRCLAGTLAATDEASSCHAMTEERRKREWGEAKAVAALEGEEDGVADRPRLRQRHLPRWLAQPDEELIRVVPDATLHLRGRWSWARRRRCSCI